VSRTPGPWEVIPPDASEPWSIYGPKGLLIDWQGASKEDARLIAAAPELYDIAVFVAGKRCARMASNPDGPTCRSTVPGEGLLRAEWCVSCRAREAVLGAVPV
jgi:hypothetical protein